MFHLTRREPPYQALGLSDTAGTSLAFGLVSWETVVPFQFVSLYVDPDGIFILIIPSGYTPPERSGTCHRNPVERRRQDPVLS